MEKLTVDVFEDSDVVVELFDPIVELMLDEWKEGGGFSGDHLKVTVTVEYVYEDK